MSSMSSAWPLVRGSCCSGGARAIAMPALISSSGARPWWERASRAHGSPVDEEGFPPAWGEGGRDQAGAQGAELFEPAEPLEELLERVDAVAETGRFFVAEAFGQVGQSLPETGQRASVEEMLELVEGGVGERARCELGLPAAADGAELGRGLGDDELVASTLQVETVVGSSAAGVGGRLQFADQPELLERGLELGAEDAPFDPLEGEERRLYGRTLAFALEVGAQAGAQVAGAADVEHLVVPVAEQVHARPGRCPADERALAVHASFARRGEGAQLGEAAGTQLLGEPDQPHEHLRGRLRVRQRSVAGSGCHPEEVGERREADPVHAAIEQAAGERRGAKRRLRQPAAFAPPQLPLEEALVEAGVVRNQRCLGGKDDEAAEHGRDAGRVPQVALAQPGQTGNRLRERNARIDKGLEAVDQLERLDADRAQLADPAGLRREPGRLQVEDHELRLLQQRVRRARERHGRPRAEDPAVAGAHLGHERGGEPRRDRARRKQDPRRVDHG